MIVVSLIRAGFNLENFISNSDPFIEIIKTLS